MNLNESIVEEAALEWFLLRSAPLNYGGQVGEQCCVAPTLIPAFCLRPSPLRSGSQREKEQEREALRRPAAAGPVIPEAARATLQKFRIVNIERWLNP